MARGGASAAALRASRTLCGVAESGQRARIGRKRITGGSLTACAGGGAGGVGDAGAAAAAAAPVTLPPCFVVPGRLVVRVRLAVEPRVQPIVRQLESFLHDEGSVRVVDEVIVRDAAVLDRVVDQPAEERDIAAGTNLEEEIGVRRGPREARIDDDHFGVALQFGFNRPFEAARVVLRRIAAHDQHHVGVLDVDPAVRHRAASECGPQTGDRWPVSNPGLVFYVADPHAAHRLHDQVVEFVRVGAAAGEGDAFAAIDSPAAASLSRQTWRRASASRVARFRRGPDPRRCPPNGPSQACGLAASAAAGR